CKNNGILKLPLQGALSVNALYPGRCPGLWRKLGFQPAFVLLLPYPPIESSSYIKIKKEKYLL
ncbi:MAG: hypothetical protein U0K29_01795, partial [Prevotella sp.]|nr:hypothetical protein [Prevotella sp.]